MDDPLTKGPFKNHVDSQEGRGGWPKNHEKPHRGEGGQVKNHVVFLSKPIQ